MKTPSTANHSVASTKPNTGSNPMKSTKTSRFSKPAHILVGSILALALAATPAMGDATWIGGGGADTNWSNMANWSGNPKAGGSLFINAMASPFTSTVEVL